MILCCGEALIDMIPEPTVSGPDGYVPRTGGAIFNTSIGLGRLGCSAGLLSGVSTDLFGQQLVDGLTTSGVATGRLIRSDRPTTLAFVKLTDGHATYSFYDENSAGRMISVSDLPSDISDVSALYFGGISLACEPGADTYLHFAETHAASRAVMLDPNIRPGFISDAARFRRRMLRMISIADIVKVSDEDLDWIFPGDAPLEDKVAQLRALGPSVVILTRGAEGASAWLPDGRSVFVPSQKVTVVDTVGAGDTFNSGVLANLSEAGLLTKEALRTLTDHQITAALAFGARVAAVTVSRAGANPPLRSEL